MQASLYSAGRYIKQCCYIAFLIIAALLFISARVSADTKVNLYTGSATYSLPIVTSPGTNGVGPKLSLQYNSDNGDGSLGKGWSLTGLGEIERRGPTYGPSPTGTESDTYILKLNGIRRLVYAGTDPAGNTGNYYRTEIESNRRIEYDKSFNDWIITDTDGTKYYFGSNPNAGSRSQGGGSFVVRWELDKVMDTHGVFWTVAYDIDRAGGDVYPKQIVYSQGAGLTCSVDTITNLAIDKSVCRTIDFSLRSRADKPIITSYTELPRVEDKLLDTITVTLGGKTVRSYKLAYDFTSSAPSRDRAPDYVLSSVTQYGADGTSALPATRFKYNKESETANSNTLGLLWNYAPNYLPTGPGAQPQVGGDPVTGAGRCNYFVDLTGDGYPGVLMGNPGAWTYVDKPGETWNQYDIPNPTGSQLPSLCATTTRTITHYHLRFRKWNSLLPFTPKIEKTYESQQVPISNVVVIDIDGDGTPDVVDGTNSQWYWYRNLRSSPVYFSSKMAITGGPGISLTDENNKPIYNGSPATTRPHRSLRFADMDGDGLVDIFEAEKVLDDGSMDTYWNFRWWKNLGGGNFATTPVTMSGEPNWKPILTANGYADFFICYGANFDPSLPEPECYNMVNQTDQTIPPPLDPNRLSLIDVNGDGLLDLVAQLYTVEYTGQKFDWNTIGIHYEYLVNQDGGKYFRKPIRGDMVVALTGTHSLPNDAKLSPSVRWIDMNGDGLTDLLVGTAGNYRYYPQRYQDGDLDPPITLANPPTEFGSNPPKYLALTRKNYLSVTDFDGDGLPDIVLTPPMAVYGIYSVDNTVDLGLFHKLTDVTNSMGGMSSLHYQLLHSGNSIKWVPKDLRISAKVGDPDQFRTYSFSGGKYAGWPYFEFRGYSDAVVTDAAGIQSTSKFFQDDTLKGRVSQTSKDTQTDSYQYAVSEHVAGVIRVNPAAHVAKTSSSSGNKSISTTYDSYDGYGNPTQTTVSGDGIATRVTTTDYVYNTNAYIVNRASHSDTRIGDASGNKISETWFDYDKQSNGTAPTIGDLTSETHWNSTGDDPVTQYAYDGYGNRVATTDADANTCASTGYTSKGEYETTYYTFPISSTNALCQKVTKTYWGINANLDASAVTGAYVVPGQLATVTDANSVSSDSYWDVLGRARASVIPPDTAAAPTILTSYSVTGVAPSSITVSKRESMDGGTFDEVTVLDGLGRSIQKKSESATAGEWNTQDTFYNNRGLSESVTIPYFSYAAGYTPRSTTQAKTTTLYDAQGRPTKVTNADGTFKQLGYDLWDLSTTDEKGNTTTRSYDALNRLSKVVEPDGGGTTTYMNDYYGTATLSLGHNFRFVFDTLGNLVDFPEYDTLGRKVSDYDADRSIDVYTYDANGNMLTKSDAKAQKLIYTYDKLNRISTKTYPDGSVINYYYDDPTPGKYRIGRLWRVTDPSGSTIYSYDQRGRKVQEDKVIGSNTFTKKTSYDSMNRVQTLIYPDGEVVQNTYDDGGMLSKVHSNSYNFDYLVDSSYTPWKKILSRTYGNGKVTSYDYYPDNLRLHNIATPGLQDLSYDYDDNGNIHSITDTINAASQTFDYDALNRLASASSTASPSFNYTYGYDAIGNMRNGEGNTYTYPTPGASHPHAPISSNACGSFGYDNNGNLSTSVCGGVTKTFSWDYDNRLTQVTSGNSVLGKYTYDFAGQRVKRVERRVTTLMPFPIYRTIRGTVTKYYFANGQRIAERTGGTAPSNVYYYHPDHLGSSNVVSDSTGTQVKLTLFYPFGAARTETGSKQIEQKYNGKDFDQKTGLYNFGSRYYDPSIMHFISADSTVPNSSDPQLFNRYAYVRNNPVRLIDPTGHAPDDPNQSIMNAAGAIEVMRSLNIGDSIKFISSISNPNTRVAVTYAAFNDMVKANGPHPDFGSTASINDLHKMAEDPSLIYAPYLPQRYPGTAGLAAAFDKLDKAQAKVIQALGRAAWDTAEDMRDIHKALGPLEPFDRYHAADIFNASELAFMYLGQSLTPYPAGVFNAKLNDWTFNTWLSKALPYPANWIVDWTTEGKGFESMATGIVPPPPQPDWYYVKDGDYYVTDTECIPPPTDSAGQQY